MEYLAHHGIKGQRWGFRRFQNEDGTLTEAGRKRYLKSDGSVSDKFSKDVYKTIRKQQSGKDISGNEIIQEKMAKSDSLQKALKEAREFDNKVRSLEEQYEASKDKYVLKTRKNWENIKKKDPNADDPDEYAYILFMDDHYKGGMKSFVDDRAKISEASSNAAYEFAKEFLGKYSDMPVGSLYSIKPASELLGRSIYVDELLRSKK